MGILSRILKPKKEQSSNSDVLGITVFNIDLTDIPKYKELNEEAKKKVDTYISEINIEQRGKLIYSLNKYEDKTQRKADRESKLFFNLMYKKSSEPIKFDNEDEVIQEWADRKIEEQKLKSYQQRLEDLLEEVVLKIVAIEKIKKENKFLKISEVFAFNLEGLKEHKAKQRILEETITRLALLKQSIQKQIQAEYNAQINDITISNTIEQYKRIEDYIENTVEGIERKKQEVLSKKVEELNKMIKCINPEHKGITLDGKIENDVEQIALLEMELEEYVYMHEKEIEKLEEKVKKIDEKEKTKQNRTQLLEEVEYIRIKYRIFEKYQYNNEAKKNRIKAGLKELYKVKLDILTLDINEQKESPIKEITDEEERTYYQEIIADKIHEIIMGDNEELRRNFGGKNIQEAVEIIKGILQDEKDEDEKDENDKKKKLGRNRILKNKKEINAMKILEDRVRLGLILALDRKEGLDNFTINKKDYTGNLYEDIFTWQDNISFKGINQLRQITEVIWNSRENKIHESNLDENDSLITKLYKLYKKEHNREAYYKAEYYGHGSLYEVIPEGIIELKKGIPEFFDKLKSLKYERAKQFGTKYLSYFAGWICPKTLRVIGEGAFKNYSDSLKTIQLNYGLREIGDEAFYGSQMQFCYLSNGEFPDTLEKIGSRAFYQYKGEEWVHFPSSIREIGEDILKDSSVDSIKFKDFKNVNPEIVNRILAPIYVKTTVRRTRERYCEIKGVRFRKKYNFDLPVEECYFLKQIILDLGENRPPIYIDAKNLCRIGWPIYTRGSTAKERGKYDQIMDIYTRNGEYIGVKTRE